jgi:hypothetical protein
MTDAPYITIFLFSVIFRKQDCIILKQIQTTLTNTPAKRRHEELFNRVGNSGIPLGIPQQIKPERRLRDSPLSMVIYYTMFSLSGSNIPVSNGNLHETEEAFGFLGDLTYSIGLETAEH